MKIGTKLSLIIIFFLISSHLEAQDQGELKDIRFNKILVNGEAKDIGTNTVLISSRDTIAISYGVEVGKDELRRNFLFRIGLIRGNDQKMESTGSPSATYMNLAEDRYLFVISAFDLEGTWRTPIDTLIIEVDDSKAALAAEIGNLQLEIMRKDSLLKAMESGKSEQVKPRSMNTYLLLTIALILGSVVTIFVFTILGRKEKLSHKEEANKMQYESEQKSSSLENLKEENGRLKAELSVLRGQISAMQDRSDEIQLQNKELKGIIEKLNSSKQELEELQVQKDELFAVVIHDIKNPVSLIKSLVELLTSYDLTASEQQEIMEDLTKTTLRIVSLSQEVSKIMTLEGNKLHLNYEKLDIKEILDDVYQRNKANADKKLIKMTNEVQEGLPEISIDANKIDEVADNLISNAIKFTQEGGDIRIKTVLETKGITVQISDTGLGLSEEDIKRTFMRGSKLGAKPTGGESSTGLGLWIVKKLIEAHDGRVWVKSSLGKGSTFAFYLPFERAEKKED